MKINIIELEKELFYNLVGDKKTTGLFYKKVNNKFIIFIKNSISKKNKKLTIEHELSHLFIYKFKLKNKINKKEFLRVLKDKNFRKYEEEIYYNNFRIREEYLADLISYILYGSKYEKEYIKNNYPKNFEIINKLKSRFQPKLSYI